ncbi:hypothetical protein AMECASPLE_039495 [Ameca splendens]|uniref:Uncharacterized protein n=1 Tax=Ameca splendens TaxID=208324 RepID=A0ABV0XLJ6_9TELE
MKKITGFKQRDDQTDGGLDRANELNTFFNRWAEGGQVQLSRFQTRPTLQGGPQTAAAGGPSLQYRPRSSQEAGTKQMGKQDRHGIIKKTRPGLKTRHEHEKCLRDD